MSEEVCLSLGVGVIEGFFGPEWSWRDRHLMCEFLKDTGADFYIYAPKRDSFLRKSWMQDHPTETWDRLFRAIFWTGNKVKSESISSKDLQLVARALKRHAVDLPFAFVHNRSLQGVPGCLSFGQLIWY
jgi:hypothetical protein